MVKKTQKENGLFHVAVWLSPPQMTLLQELIRKEKDLPNRSEMLRRLISRASEVAQ